MRRSFSDKMEVQSLGGMKFPTLKGHVKITLHNCMNGKNRVIEGENIITNAIPDILKYNFMNGIDAGSILPLVDTWFGGILVYEQAHTLNADNYNIPNDTHNHLFAHAGDEAPATAAIAQEDLQRGSPLQTIRTDNSITHTWEWGHAQGNSGDRYIRSLALCHKDVGNAGLGNLSTAFHNLNPFAKINVGTSAWTAFNIAYEDAKDVHAMYDDANGLSFKLDSGNIIVSIKKLAYLKTGLCQTMTASSSLARTFTITPPFTLYAQPCYYFDRTTKYLWIFTNMTSATTRDVEYIKYFVIDCENEALVDLGSGVYYKTIQSDYAKIAPLGVLDDYTNLIKQGSDVFFPTSDNPSMHQYNGVNVTGLQRIDLSNTADQETITLNDVQTYYQSFMSGGDILVNSGRVVNGDTGFTCASFLPVHAETLHNHLFSTPDLVSSYVQPVKMDGYTSSITYPRYILANKFVHTTLYNIPNADIFHKTATESMSIAYTIEEV